MNRIDGLTRRINATPLSPARDRLQRLRSRLYYERVRHDGEWTSLATMLTDAALAESGDD